jgi:hypothetical protein
MLLQPTSGMAEQSLFEGSSSRRRSRLSGIRLGVRIARPVSKQSTKAWFEGRPMADLDDVIAANRAAVVDLVAAAERSAATWITPRAPER